MKIFFIGLITCALLFSYGCHEKRFDDDEKWIISDDLISFRLEYNTQKQLTKYSRFRNDSLSSYHTFDYIDSSLTERVFDQNSVETAEIIFTLDTNGRAVKSYSAFENYIMDTITYSTSGFLNSVLFINNSSFIFNDNGSELNLESAYLFSIIYTPSEILSKTDLPNTYSLNVVLRFTGLFGRMDQHLIESYNSVVYGPGRRSTTGSFEYEFDAQGYVTQVKQYISTIHRNQPEHEYGLISYVTYEYVFE